MPIVRYGERLNVLVVAKGHPYQRDAFMGIFDEMEGVSASLVEQPAAALLMNPETAREFDAIVLYDMPGLDFRTEPRPGFVAPSAQFKKGFLAMLDQGIGIVALHHAIAGWPAWEEYAELLGGRFLYRPATLRGRTCQDSGYRHDVRHEISAVDVAHPILNGVTVPFTLTDELYLFEVFENSVTPLLRSNHRFVRDNFYSAALAVSGKMFSNEGGLTPMARISSAGPSGRATVHLSTFSPATGPLPMPMTIIAGSSPERSVGPPRTKRAHGRAARDGAWFHSSRAITNDLSGIRPM